LQLVEDVYLWRHWQHQRVSYRRPAIVVAWRIRTRTAPMSGPPRLRFLSPRWLQSRDPSTRPQFSCLINSCERSSRAEGYYHAYVANLAGLSVTVNVPW